MHGLRDRATQTQLWTWSLKTAYTRVIEMMARAGIADPRQAPKGCGMGLAWPCIEKKGFLLNLVQHWLGDAQLSTTAIYADAVGERGAPYRRPPLDLTRGNHWERFFRGGVQRPVTDSQGGRRSGGLAARPRALIHPSTAVMPRILCTPSMPPRKT